MIITARNMNRFLSDTQCAITFECSYKAKEALEQLERGDYEVTIIKQRKGRTLAQNRYLWELLGQISVAENGNTSEDVNIYCQLIEQCGAKCEYMLVPSEEDVVKRLMRVYRAVKVLQARPYNGKVMWMVKCFYGSSKMDTKEMGMLIDKAIERAEADGIDTDPWRERLIEVGRNDNRKET